jgi:hypothetical protein
VLDSLCDDRLDVLRLKLDEDSEMSSTITSSIGSGVIGLARQSSGTAATTSTAT